MNKNTNKQTATDSHTNTHTQMDLSWTKEKHVFKESNKGNLLKNFKNIYISTSEGKQPSNMI